jgi:hypothetical protein
MSLPAPISGPPIGQTFPGAQTPLVGPGGTATIQWLRFFLSLYNTTGGGSPINVTVVNNNATAAQAAAEAAATAAAEAAEAASDVQVQTLFDERFQPPDQGPFYALMLS